MTVGGLGYIRSFAQAPRHSGGTAAAVAQLLAGGLPPRMPFLENGGRTATKDAIP